MFFVIMYIIEGGVIKTSDGACGQTTNEGTPAAISNDQTATSSVPAFAEASAGESEITETTATSTPLEVSGAGAATVANGDLLLTGQATTTPDIITSTETTTATTTP